MNEDRKLAQKLKKRDEQAFERIVDKFTPFSAAIICNVSGGTLSKEDIEEAVMDVFITLWRNSEKVQEDKLKGYIACISKSKAKNKLALKKQAVMVDIEEIDIEDSFSVSDETETKDLKAELLDILDTFGKQDREIFIRHYFYYQKLSDIALSMNLNSETVKVKLFRARKKLKKELAERGYEI